MFTSVFCKMLVQIILQDSNRYSSSIKPPRHKTHTPYADTSVLQTLCVDRALSLELTNGTCNQRRTNVAYSIVSLATCLLLTKIARDFGQKWLFYRQFLIGYSFANCTVCVSFFIGYIYTRSKTFLYKKFGLCCHGNCGSEEHLVFTNFRIVSICLSCWTDLFVLVS